VHRKRSQLAAINHDGKVLTNRNGPNKVKPILSGSAARQRDLRNWRMD
jgi:hypothetical protein